MNKEDQVLFGKFKGETWKNLLSSEDGIKWGDWWSETHSKGPYANRENKQKNVWREWRGLQSLDTRQHSVGFDPREMYEILDRIESKIDSLVPPEAEGWIHE